MSSILPEYNSDATSSDDAENEEELFTKRVRSNYIFKSKFDSRAESKSEVLAQKSWLQRFTKNLEDDKRIYYNCKWSRKCPAKMMLIIPHNTNEVFQYVTDAAHNHKIKECGLPEVTKAAVKKLFDVGVRKPNAVLKSLREQ